MKETSHLLLSLTVISIAAGVLVASVERLTRGPIARAKEAAEMAGIADVLPKDAGVPTKRLIPAANGTTNVVYVAGQCVAVKVATERGYGGRIEAIVGFDAEGTLYNYTVVAHAETPGLGSRIEDAFRTNVVGRPAGTAWKVKKDGGDIDALASATISSRAMCGAIADAARIRNEVIGGSGK